VEDAAVSRAVDGWEEAVYQGGRQVGTVRKFDSALLMFMLRARRPETYRERTEIRHESGVRQLTDDELRVRRELGRDPEYAAAAETMAAKLTEKLRAEGEL
jgi:hypothetical protein